MTLVKFRKIAQSTAEYAIVFALVIAAAMAMQTYVKRGLQGRVRDATDYVGADWYGDADSTHEFTAEQYEPYYMDSDFHITREVDGGRYEVAGDAAITDEFSSEEQNRTGTQTYQAPE